MGLLPLIKGLPVRLTDHIDRNLGLYKQTKCTIHGWTLNINEASAKDDLERVLDFQPDMIYLKFENAKWRVHDDLEQGVYPMKVTGKVWNISENTKMKAKRLGFQIVPDFGQTAHSVQGASLAAVIVDCLKVDLCTKTTEMLAAYIGLSRVRRKEALLIAEPFSPALFCHGQPPGPEILMKVLRREITADDAEKDFVAFLLDVFVSHTAPTKQMSKTKSLDSCSRVASSLLCMRSFASAVVFPLSINYLTESRSWTSS